MAKPTDCAYGLTSLIMLPINPTLCFLVSSAKKFCWVISEIFFKLECVLMLLPLKILMKAFDDIYDFVRINLSLLINLITSLYGSIAITLVPSPSGRKNHCLK